MTQSSRSPLCLHLPQARPANVISLVLLLCFVGYVTANSNWHCSNVYSTVQSVCDSCYAGVDKRTNTPYRTIDEPFVERKNAMDFFKRGTARGSRRGIVDECCLKQCDVSELVMYCCEAKQREYYTFVGWLKRR